MQASNPPLPQALPTQQWPVPPARQAAPEATGAAGGCCRAARDGSLKLLSGPAQELIGSFFLSQEREREWEREAMLRLLAQKGMWAAVATIMRGAAPGPGQ